MIRFREKSYLVTIKDKNFKDTMYVNARTKKEAKKKTRKVITNSHLWNISNDFKISCKKEKGKK